MIGTKLRIALTVFALAYFVNKYYNAKVHSPIVQIVNGKVRGTVDKSRNEKDYFSYRGIPYAQPPVGSLRFEPPQPLSPLELWTDVRDTSSFATQCLQLDLLAGKPAGEEDCLTLNVFTPKLGGQNKSGLPVMVFYHGGSFLSGTANVYDAKYFMDEKVVLVTVNYRLGALGFLNTGDEVVSGNMGLKDQTMSLKWVQANIASFGGNPDKVTIFGNSAGGSACHYHILSPMSKGLFQRAISQSGTAIAPWATFKHPKKQAERFAKLLNCSTGNSKEMVDCLKNINGYDLVDIHKEILIPLREEITVFVPTIESNMSAHPQFLTADPYELLKSGNFNKEPWMAGVNSHEGLLYAAAVYRNDTMVKRMLNDFEDVVGKILWVHNPTPTQSETLERIRKFYLGSKHVGYSESAAEEQFKNYTNIFSDSNFFIPLHKSAELQGIHSPVYLYFYSYERDVSLAKYILASKGRYPVLLEVAYEIISDWVKKNLFWMEIPKIGVCHSDELGIVFPVVWDSDITAGGKHYEMSKDIIKLWVSFANHEEIQFRNVNWQQAHPENQDMKYLRLDEDPNIIDSPFASRIPFWNTVTLNNQPYEIS